MQYALFYIDFFVNNIQKNHHLTALNGDFIIVCVTFLIMPFIGLSPFLLDATENSSLLEDLCQCPLSGFFHFYMKNDLLGRLEEVMCQCPLSGFFHFYLKRSSLELLLLVRVNALYQASSISTLPSGNALK